MKEQLEKVITKLILPQYREIVEFHVQMSNTFEETVDIIYWFNYEMPYDRRRDLLKNTRTLFNMLSPDKNIDIKQFLRIRK